MIIKSYIYKYFNVKRNNYYIEYYTKFTIFMNWKILNFFTAWAYYRGRSKKFRPVTQIEIPYINFYNLIDYILFIVHEYKKVWIKIIILIIKVPFVCCLRNYIPKSYCCYGEDYKVHNMIVTLKRIYQKLHKIDHLIRNQSNLSNISRKDFIISIKQALI
jgi:hypothetical protein